MSITIIGKHFLESSKVILSLQNFEKEIKEIVESIDAEIQKYEEIHTSKIEGWEYSSNSKVLVAEIPKSGNRWKQANFDK